MVLIKCMLPMAQVCLLVMLVNPPFILVILIPFSKIYSMFMMPQRILFWSISSHMIITSSLNFIHGISLSRTGTRGGFYFEEDVETVSTLFPWMDG
jgi:hypothetical protein